MLTRKKTENALDGEASEGIGNLPPSQGFLIGWMAFFFGLGCAFYFSLKGEPSLYEVFCAVLLSCAVFLCGFFLLGKNRLFFVSASLWEKFKESAFSVLMILVFFEAGFADSYFQAHLQPPFPNVPYNAVYVKGILSEISSQPASPWPKRRWRLRISHPVLERSVDQGMKPLKRHFDISWVSAGKPPPVGSQIKIRALLHLPSQPLWTGGYDPQRAAWFSGLGAKGRALGDPVLLRPPTGVFSISASYWEKWRDKTAEKIRQNMKDAEQASVAEILICGKEGDLSKSLRTQFSAAGLAHILAVAGLHLGMVMAFTGFLAYVVIRRFEWMMLRFFIRKMTLFFGLAAGGAYIFFTGAHVPGLRALGVASLGFLALWLRRSPFSLRSLAFVAFAFEITAPWIVLNAAFQMSFCAVMALGAAYRALAPACAKMRAWGKFGKYVALPLFTLGMTSLIAGTAVIPSVMRYFGVFQPWFLLANLIAVPVMGVWVMPLAVLSLCAMVFHLESVFLFLMGKGVAVIIASARWAADLPFASVAVPAMSGEALAVSLFGLTFLCLWQNRLRFLGILFFIAGIVAPIMQQKPVMLFSASGREGAVFDGEKIWVFSAGKGENKNEKKFVIEAWQKAFGLAPQAREDFSCSTRSWCKRVFKLKGGKPVRIGWVSTEIAQEPRETGGQAIEQDICPNADLLVSFAYGVRKCSEIPILTPRMTWKEGSFSGWQNRSGGIDIASDLATRGSRLWVYPLSRQGKPNIPQALSE